MREVQKCVREYMARMRAAKEARKERTRAVLRCVGNWLEEGKKKRMKEVLRIVGAYLRKWRMEEAAQKQVVEGTEVEVEEEGPAQEGPGDELTSEQVAKWNAVNSAIHTRRISFDDGNVLFHHIRENPHAGWPSKAWAWFFSETGSSSKAGEDAVIEAEVEAFIAEIEQEEEEEGVDKSLAVANPAGEVQAPAKKGRKMAKSTIPPLIEHQPRGATHTRFCNVEAHQQYNKMGARNADAKRPFHPAVVKLAGFQKVRGGTRPGLDRGREGECLLRVDSGGLRESLQQPEGGQPHGSNNPPNSRGLLSQHDQPFPGEGRSF